LVKLVRSAMPEVVAQTTALAVETMQNSLR